MADDGEGVARSVHSWRTQPETLRTDQCDVQKTPQHSLRRPRCCGEVAMPEALRSGGTAEGHVDPGFERLIEVFDANFRERKEWLRRRGAGMDL